MIAVNFDPFASDFIANPYPVYDSLRAQSPIFWHADSRMWFFTTREDVSTLLRDRRFGRTLLHIMSRQAAGLPPIRDDLKPFYKLSEHSMFDKEPPEHTRLKSLVHKVFTPRRVESLRAQIQKITDTLLDAAEARGGMDLLEDFATPLPVTVIAELLGVPEADRHHLRPWSQAIVAMYELDHTPEQERRAVQAAIEFSDYLRQLARERRRNPQNDLITALAQVEEQGDTLSEDELISTCVLLLNAGHEATANVIGNGMLALLHHPAQFDRLRANPALVSTAVEEMMRYDTPLQLFRRWTLEDVVYKGIELRRGTQIALVFGAANRDPAVFDQPNTFDITRADNPHISFGGGVHYCLGAPLARLELQIAIRTLIERFPTLRLDGPEPEYRPAYVIRGLKAFPVTW
ncbi:MAG TPA: cytochrome P450 [Spirillospora sp.]|nr:cytochrome P450 [Spirillospora sp.]